MPPLPTSREGLRDAGYEYTGDGVCRGCGAELEWWITPNDKHMPFELIAVHKDPNNETSPVVRFDRIAHWSRCPEHKQFRKEKP